MSSDMVDSWFDGLEADAESAGNPRVLAERRRRGKAHRLGLVMDLMLPLYEDILENATYSCSVPDHGVIMSFVRTALRHIKDIVEAVRATDPNMHLGAHP